jgi:WD40 repeat protein
VFSPDGATLYSTSADQSIRTWDVATRKSLDVMRGHDGEMWRLALLPDGHTLVSGSKNGDVSFWDTSVRHEHRERIDGPEPVNGWKFAADGNGLITFTQAGQVAKWTGPHFEHKDVVLEIGQHAQLRSSKDDRLLAARVPGEGIHIWDVPNQKVTAVIKTATAQERPMAFLMQGTRLLTFSDDDKMNREWELATNRLIQTWPDPTASQIGNLTPDERQVVIIGLEGNISIRDLAAQQTTQLDLDVIEPGASNFSADGRLFAIASYFGYVRVWNTADWQEVATLRGYRLAPNGAAFSQDGRRLVTTGVADDTIKLWDTESWQEVLTLMGVGGGADVGMSADGNTIAAWRGTGGLQIWQAPGWAEIEAAEAENAADAPSPPLP